MNGHAAPSGVVDFSLTYFVTGAQFLVKKGSAIHGIQEHRAGASPPSRIDEREDRP